MKHQRILDALLSWRQADKDRHRKAEDFFQRKCQHYDLEKAIVLADERLNHLRGLVDTEYPVIPTETF